MCGFSWPVPVSRGAHSTGHRSRIECRQDPRPLHSHLGAHRDASLFEQGPQGSLITLNGSCLNSCLPCGAIESHLSSIAPEGMSVICDHSGVIDPWQWCESDDDVIADFLAASIQSLIESGGWIHPAARFVARDGELHVECDAEEGATLIRLPAAAMLPVTRVHWDTGSEGLAMTDLIDWPHTADIASLLTQIGLHNSCAKLPRLSTTHPSASTDLSDHAIAAMQALRPSFRTRPMSPAEIFWATRTFRLEAFGETAEPVALPLIDLLNHHPRGSVGQWHDGSFTVTVRRPTDSAECFLDYGMHRDALDTAVVYGFADTTATIAHSAPLTITTAEDHSGSAVVQIVDAGRRADGSLLPFRAQSVDDAWVLNRFTFGIDDAPDALASATGQPVTWCASVVSAIARANIELLDELDAQLSPVPDASVPDAPSRDVLLAATGHQRAILQRFATEATEPCR